MSEWTLTRYEHDVAADALHGTLDYGSGRCVALERASKRIKPGRWRVLMTVSGRATSGSLWSPRADHRLPLILVDGREGIRIHAANEAHQLEGCVAPGLVRHEERIGQSRGALINVMAALDASRDAVWLTVTDAT